MWVDERIFSLGDLSEGVHGEKYSEFMNFEYCDNFEERLYHVEKMIERLEAEKNMLLKHLKEVE